MTEGGAGLGQPRGWGGSGTVIELGDAAERAGEPQEDSPGPHQQAGRHQTEQGEFTFGEGFAGGPG